MRDAAQGQVPSSAFTPFTFVEPQPQVPLEVERAHAQPQPQRACAHAQPQVQMHTPSVPPADMGMCMREGDANIVLGMGYTGTGPARVLADDLKSSVCVSHCSPRQPKPQPQMHEYSRQPESRAVSAMLSATPPE